MLSAALFPEQDEGEREIKQEKEQLFEVLSRSPRYQYLLESKKKHTFPFICSESVRSLAYQQTHLQNQEEEEEEEP